MNHATTTSGLAPSVRRLPPVPPLDITYCAAWIVYARPSIQRVADHGDRRRCRTQAHSSWA